MKSVLQDWVTKLPLREQGTLLTGVRGCDVSPKEWDAGGQVVETMERQLTAYIRWCFMNPADPREVDCVPGAFFRSRPPQPLKASGLGHFPLHWYSHAMHCLEVIAYRHPDVLVRNICWSLYTRMVYSLHLVPESRDAMIERLSEDRIASGTVVS